MYSQIPPSVRIKFDRSILFQPVNCFSKAIQASPLTAEIWKRSRAICKAAQQTELAASSHKRTNNGAVSHSLIYMCMPRQSPVDTAAKLEIPFHGDLDGSVTRWDSWKERELSSKFGE
ncbi:hypothetical protein JTE90_023842 [Oedothorax gibbosus]|uniref:Uncharacterized protein n=1 Tax=Oedothorax gibbosus TaxID=931172 RepID=A0AAV6VHX2_9ARAC|nr:hypothetical protein JTE90_023842 [Oedothorax gibbosus]